MNLRLYYENQTKTEYLRLRLFFGSAGCYYLTADRRTYTKFVSNNIMKPQMYTH